MNLKSSFAALLVAAFSTLAGCASELPEGGQEQDSEGVETAGDELIAGSLPGYYSDWRADHVEGDVYKLRLRANGTFTMTIEGLFGCSYAGYDCPRSFTSGSFGWTDVQGSWTKSGTGFVLQPKGGKNTKASAPIVVKGKLAGDRLAFTGTIVPNRVIRGTMKAEAYDNTRKTMNLADLNGTWRVTDAVNAEGFQMQVDGTNYYFGKMAHTFVVDAAKGTYDERRADASNRKPDGNLEVLGAPDKAYVGALYMDESVGHVAYVVSFSRNAMVVKTNSGTGAVLHLVK